MLYMVSHLDLAAVISCFGKTFMKTLCRILSLFPWRYQTVKARFPVRISSENFRTFPKLENNILETLFKILGKSKLDCFASKLDKATKILHFWEFSFKYRLNKRLKKKPLETDFSIDVQHEVRCLCFLVMLFFFSLYFKTSLPFVSFYLSFCSIVCWLVYFKKRINRHLKMKVKAQLALQVK